MTEAEYEAKLERFEEIFQTEPGDETEAEFLRLADELEAYEEEHHPIGPPTEAAALRFRAEQEGRVNLDWQ